MTDVYKAMSSLETMSLQQKDRISTEVRSLQIHSKQNGGSHIACLSCGTLQQDVNAKSSDKHKGRVDKLKLKYIRSHRITEW